MRALLHGGRIWGGTAAVAVAGALSVPFSSSADVAKTGAGERLTPADWTPLTLIHKEQLTGGERPTILFRFSVPEGQEPFPVTSCLLARVPVGTKEDGSPKFVLRPYTPISPPDSKTLDLAVKIYNDGKFTPHLSKLEARDVVDFKGPIPKLEINEAAKKSSIGMIAGGTGITPMLQLASELLRQGYSKPITLIYANVSPQEIMLKSEIDDLAKKHKNFNVYYVVDKADKTWKGGVGYISEGQIKEYMPKPFGNNMIAVCGPPGMMTAISGQKVSPKEQGPLEGMLKKLGYNENEVFKF